MCAWSHILCQFGLPSIRAAEANYIMTQACLAAAIGHKKPAHLREPHPGYVNFMKLLMLCLHPVPLQQFAVRVLLPLQQSIIGRLLAMPDGDHLSAMRVCHVIGHSAGSYGGMVLSKVLTDVAFLQLVGTTRVTAVAMPASLLQVRYGSSRRVHLVHVCDDKLCVWRPVQSDMKELESRGISVTYLEGSFHWARPVTIMDTSMLSSSSMGLMKLKTCLMSPDSFLPMKNKERLFASCRGARIACLTTCAKRSIG